MVISTITSLSIINAYYRSLFTFSYKLLSTFGIVVYGLFQYWSREIGLGMFSIVTFYSITGDLILFSVVSSLSTYRKKSLYFSSNLFFKVLLHFSFSWLAGVLLILYRTNRDYSFILSCFTFQHYWISLKYYNSYFYGQIHYICNKLHCYKILQYT